MPDEQIAALERQHAHLRSQFTSIGEMRSGSLTERFRPCGKAGCHCAKPSDPGHGPVLSLTRKQAGKTVTRIIPAQAGPETQARLAEYRRFRQLSKMFIEVNDALSEARLATGSAAKNRRPRCSPSRWRPKRHVRSSGCWGPTRRRHWATSRRPRSVECGRHHDEVVVAHADGGDAVPEGRAEEADDRLRVPRRGPAATPSTAARSALTVA